MISETELLPEGDFSAAGTLAVVTMETIWPANHGGRVDPWNRWRLMKALGWKLILISWADSEEADPAQRAALGSVFSETHFFANRRSPIDLVRRLAMLPRHSPHISARYVAARRRAELVHALRQDPPEAVMLDGLYGALLATALARDLSVPLFYRAHNIEHLYMPRQARAAQQMRRKVALTLASLHLERLETAVYGTADWTFNISAEDMRFWVDRGFTRMSWLPPLIELPPLSERVGLPWADRPYDACYLGNLNTPNNVEGLAWFVREVLPLLASRRPDIRILVAGSNPSAGALALLRGNRHVDLLPNPQSAAAVRAQGRVMINPLLTGSGVNVKSIEMLFTDSPVVTTGIGVQGLTSKVREAFLVADDPGTYAALITTALDGGPVPDYVREPYRNMFGLDAAKTFSERLRNLLDRGRSPC